MNQPIKIKSNVGITLIELILVISMVMLLGIMTVPFYSRFFTQNAVSNTTDMLVGQLRKAQTYAMSGKRNSNWGVHYASNQFILFQGNSYATRNTALDERTTVNTIVTISGMTDIIFFRKTGTPSATATITISGANISDSVTVNSQGGISK